MSLGERRAPPSFTALLVPGRTPCLLSGWETEGWPALLGTDVLVEPSPSQGQQPGAGVAVESSELTDLLPVQMTRQEPGVVAAF